MCSSADGVVVDGLPAGTGKRSIALLSQGSCYHTMAPQTNTITVDLESCRCEHCCQLRDQQAAAQKSWQLPEFQSGSWKRIDTLRLNNVA